MNLTDFASLDIVPEYEHVWDVWREMTHNGVSSYPDDEIRNLFAQLSTVQAHDEMRLALEESKRDSKQVELNLVESLLVSKSLAKSMNQKLADAHASATYEYTYRQLDEYQTSVTIWKGKLRATATAANALSRELSARISK